MASVSKQPSLPSFAQTFNGQSMAELDRGSNSLPPIQPRPSLSEGSRKRSRTDNDHYSDSSHNSQQEVAVKEEDHDQEYDMLEPSPPLDGSHATSGLTPGPSKRRRTTVSGPSRLNTSVQPSGQDNPVSPVVMGLNVTPGEVHKVRSMKTVKEQQKALIEHRRGSVPNLPPPAPLGHQATATRGSPNLNAASLNVSGRRRPPTPPPNMVVPSQTSSNGNASQTLPNPPVSFARRRAGQIGGGKKKPADILISPREAVTQEQFQPLIQSAPPVPNKQGGRFPMSLPRLPAMGGSNNTPHRPPGRVPPTPTRFTLHSQAAATSHAPIQPIASGLAGRSPPNPSVGISSAARVPPTPHSLQHPGYAQEKSAFLAPFEMFYDALNDSKQMKQWLSEQLQKSETLSRNLAHQQDHIGELVESLVERKVGSMRREIVGLQRRVEDLEAALRDPRRRGSFDATYPPSSSSSRPIQPGRGYSGPNNSYSFPPAAPERLRHEPIARGTPPHWSSQDRDREPSQADSDMGSPAPYDARRLSVSAARFDPPATHRSPPTSHRESGAHAGAGHHPGMAKARSTHSGDVPTLHRRRSNPALDDRDERGPSDLPLPGKSAEPSSSSGGGRDERP